MADKYMQDQLRLKDLFGEQAAIYSRATERNHELENSIKDLQREVAVWKKAFDMSEAEKASMRASTTTSNSIPESELGAPGSKLDGAVLTLCLIDGDAHFFAPELIRDGESGGARAAQMLIGGLASAEPNGPPRGAQTWTLVMLNKAAVRATLVGNGTCTSSQFDEFCGGFDGAYALFSIVDAGSTADAADKKVKEYLRAFARASNVRRVFVCGHPERPYRMALRMLQNDAAIASKLALLRGSHPVPNELSTLTPPLPVHNIPGLFVLGAATPPRSPTSASTQASSTASPWLDQPLSPAARSPPPPFTSPFSPPPGLGFGSNTLSWRSSPNHAPSSPSDVKLIDPTLPISKQNPPPCNWFYLARCNKPADKCQYSHYYTLTREQIEDMRVRAKRSPCMTTARNGVCPSGDRCILGHVCPNGQACKYLVEGKCKFTGRNMHNQS